ncbi:hypothetical protein C9374_006051 [Naegleria lovaniensis]|uniref:Uncharacterized protein n=1 Tax=Naegleria lovaniensis TaxID=51637 RepID=A0AA88GNV2_NAELO|nr:uncharacterized protein C9374_006051 [Naegleria lovaniensis]KAG2381667.1 hypothetical protein C9374_006051 [Naegleria lovaniensis]
MKTSREEGSQQWRVDEEVASPNSEMCLMRAEEKEMIMRGFSSAAKSGDMRPLHDLGESSKVESEKVSQVATTSTAPVSKEHHHNIQTNYSNKLTKPEKQSPTDGDIKQTPTSPKSPLSTPPSASKYSSSSTRSNSFRHYSTTVSTPRRSSLTQSHSNISTDASSGNIQAACISKSSASTLPSSKTPKAVTSPKDSSINSSSGRRKSFNSLQLSWRDTKVALKENLATSFSNSRYSSSFHAKDNSCNETTNFSNTSPEDTFFTPNNYWNVNNDTDSSFDDMVLPGSPIQGQVSYNQMIACIEQENDLDSVDTYKSDDTLPQEGIFWDNSDILLRTGLLLREPALSPATEYLMNSNYMKLKLNSPRTLATLMKQIEIAPPTERLPHSPIAKSARSFMLEKKRESQRRKSMPSISISSLPPVHFVATKPTTPSFEKEETKEIREEHKKTKKELERKKSLKLNEFRSIQRMYYKEELEMSREQEIAQSEMFKKQKIKEWKKKTISSPFKVDLEAHAKQTEKQIRKEEKLQERLRIIELKKKEDLRKCALIEKILENNVENVHMTKRNHIDEQKLQKWRMELSEINHL